MMPIPSTVQDDDRREDRRKRTLFAATIIMDNRMSTFDVTVRNRSNEGFLLDAENTAVIPNEFSLKLPENTVEYRCAVVRRTSNHLGVKVIGQRTPASHHTIQNPRVDPQAELRAKLAERFPHLAKT